MRPDLYAVPRRQAQRGVSGGRVAGVEAARDVDRRDQRHQLGIVRAALAEIAIEIDFHARSLLEIPVRLDAR